MSDEIMLGERESAMLITHCPNCKNKVKIERRWTPGGVNDYGGWIIECGGCKQKFEVSIGRDVSDSVILSGGVMVDQYYDNLNNRRELLKQYGIESHPLNDSRQKSSPRKSPLRKEGGRIQQQRGKSATRSKR